MDAGINVMADQAMHEKIAGRIRQRLDETGKNAAAVSRAAGYGPEFIRNFLSGKKRSMNIAALAAIARELDAPVAWLQGDDSVQPLDRTAAPAPPDAERTLPLYGTAAASQAGSIHILDDVLEWLPCPSGLKGVRGAYALYVSGTSMMPRFRPGELVFVAPGRPPRPGDDAVIQVRRAENGETEAWVKEYVTETPEQVIARQYNPPEEMRFSRREVVGLHRILSTKELIG